MARRSVFVGVLSGVVAATICVPAWLRAQEPTGVDSKNRRAPWLHELYLGDASAYRFTIDGPKKRALKLRTEPVMRWTSQDDYSGEVFVWTDNGAAAVVGCVFSGPLPGARHVMHEFHSLSGEPIRSAGGGSAWHPEAPGIRPVPVPDAPEPAGTAARRLAQMRNLARQFTAQVRRENSKWEMRLLPQPLYRYEIADDGSSVVDGAVFTFVWTAGTDPEVLLVIEARRTAQGVRWEYAPARFTNCEAWLQHRGKEVWRADPANVGIFDGVTTTPYGAFQVKSVPLPSGR